MVNLMHVATNASDPLPPLGERPFPTLIALLPCMFVLEYVLMLGGDGSTAHRVLAHERIGETLHFFGLSPVFVLHGTTILVTVVLLMWQWLSAAPWKLTFREPLQLWFEGIIATAPLLAGAAFLGSLHSTPLTTPALESGSVLDSIAVAIGAGLSEEFLFRMVGILAVHALLADLCRLPSHAATIIAVVLTSVAFTWYHDPASMPGSTVAFITAAGLYLGALYVLRGFAVAVLAHIGYDLVVLIG